MASTDVYALQNSDLNGFLFADVGVEASGLTLSVSSTLAREGMDPWQEAERLARLPRDEAVEALARTIAAMPATLWQLPDATAIARLLVALLPVPGGGPTFVFSSKPASAATRQWTVVLVLLATMLLGFTLNLLGQPGAASDGNVPLRQLGSTPMAGAAPTAGQPPTGQ